MIAGCFFETNTFVIRRVFAVASSAILTRRINARILQRETNKTRDNMNGTSGSYQNNNYNCTWQREGTAYCVAISEI